MLQSIPGVGEVHRVSWTPNLRLSEDQQLRLLSLKVVVDCIDIGVQTSDVSEVHFEWEEVQPLIKLFLLFMLFHVCFKCFCGGQEK